MQSGLVSYFVFEQIDARRKFFNSLTKEQLKNEIKSNESYLNAFKQHISNSGLLISYAQKDKILTYLYAEFARQLFDEASYYSIILKEDAMLKKVLE